MAQSDNEYRFSLEWQSDEDLSDDMDAETTENSWDSLTDAVMAESGPTLRSFIPSSSTAVVNSSALPPSPQMDRDPELEPRGYQVELFERACRENIIALLETGAGKTLVSALLIKKTLDDIRAQSEKDRSSMPPLSNTDEFVPTDAEDHYDTDQSRVTTLQDENCELQAAELSAGNEICRLVAPKSSAKKPSKIAVFLVHRVPLVPQQAGVVRRVLSPDQQVGAFYGEKGVDDWSSSKWARCLRTKQVLVMTAQIFLNLLRHGLVEMRNVALLVVDEVHHATKSHPYRRIFIEFYHTIGKEEPRPRVFGMTATPVKKRSASSGEVPCLNAIAALEVTLDATVVAVSDESQEEVETLVPKPDEYVATYKGTGEVLSDNDEEEEELENKVLSKVVNYNEGEGPIQIPSDLGDVDMDGQLNPPEMKLVARLHRKLGFKAASDFAKALCRLSSISPYKTLSLLEMECSEDDVTNGGISPRVIKLLDVLFAEYVRANGEKSQARRSEITGEKFQSIVFIQERTSALALTWLVNSIFGGLKSKELTARSVVGAQNSESPVRMSQSRLLETIDAFRRGEYGILIATNVIEEGLDIPACRLVVAFDSVISPTAYVQGRGRARKKDARYIVFIEEGSASQFESAHHARRGAKLMNDVVKCNALSNEDRQQIREKLLSESHESEKKLCSRTTRAQVGPTEAVGLLHRYCSMKSQYFNEENDGNPKYNVKPIGDGFAATVELHPKIGIDGGFCLDLQETETRAKRCAALDAYSKLYEIGEVDGFLLPRRPHRSRRVLRITDNDVDSSVRVLAPRNKQRARRAVQSRASKKHKKVRRCRVMHPQVLQIKGHVGEGSIDCAGDGRKLVVQREGAAVAPRSSRPVEQMDSEANDGHHDALQSDDLFVYSVGVDCDLTRFDWYESRKDERYGILLRDRIPAEDLTAIRCPYGEVLLSLTFEGTIPWTALMQKKAYKYVRYLQLCLRGRTPGSFLANDIEEKEYSKSTTPGFFLLPLVPHSGDESRRNIDWESIERFLSFGWRCGPPEKHEAPGFRDIQYSLICSFHEKLDRVYLSGTLHDSLMASSNPGGLLNAQYTSFEHYFRQKHSTAIANPDQQMLSARSIRETMSNLSSSVFMLAPETCRILPLSPMACYIASILPVWQTFLALRNSWRRNRIEENSVDFLSFARALQPNINNVARGSADLSYERLEFLGDAVLKVIYSMVTFVRNPEDNEGLLSDERDLEVSNQRLADLALEMKLQHCVAFSGVSQRVKSWPWFWATHQSQSIQISEKVLADCVEALIGAQFLHGGIELATAFMDKHKLLPGSCEVLGFRKPGSEEMGEKSVEVKLPLMASGDWRHESAYVLSIEKILGYQFSDRRHLVVALTHGSYENGLISSYQRYEYLGDAIIGFLLLSHFFDKYPELSPGELTALRGPALSNDLFARVIVSWKIHEKFWYHCAPLAREIKRFDDLVANEEDDEDDSTKNMTVPKVLGDLLESIVGAVVVDKGMRLDGVLEIVLRLMDEELNRFANPEKFKHNPISELVRFVQGSRNSLPKYRYLDDAKDPEKKCVVVVKDCDVGLGVGPTRRIAKRKASVAALKKLRLEDEQISKLGIRKIALCDEE